MFVDDLTNDCETAELLKVQLGIVIISTTSTSAGLETVSIWRCPAYTSPRDGWNTAKATRRRRHPPRRRWPSGTPLDRVTMTDSDGHRSVGRHRLWPVSVPAGTSRQTR